jgi:hypothetical protein
MQVPLNEATEFQGGRLVFALSLDGSKRGDGTLLVAPREVGGCSIHDNTVVHGVTELWGGVRYGLFFLRVPTQ